jgi:threonine dehydrogenase-like Zn-dependent dehydrogenase
MSEPSVRGLRQRFAASPLNYRTLRLLGGRLPRYARGWMPWLGLDRYARLPLPGADWVRLRPTMAGVCGTDMALLTGRASAVLSPFASFPAVLGHEVVGVVDEVGPGAHGFAAGERVVVDPVVGCTVRGLAHCDPCAAGHPSLCLRGAGGVFSPGLLLGFCRDLPGGWGDEMLAHASQLRHVPDAMPDEVAVLVEPFAVALHAVLADPPGPGARVLVIGGGSMGLLTLAALRLLAPDAEPTLAARHHFQAEMAERIVPGSVADGRGGVLQAAVDRAGAVRHRPIVGGDVLTGGFSQVYDCVGSAGSLDSAFRAAGPRGRVVVVGGPAEIAHLDWTLLWTRELEVAGSYVYGREPSLPGEPHTMDAALRLLSGHPGLPIGELVTHRFALRDHRRAMATALDRGRAGALKIVFRPQAG